MTTASEGSALPSEAHHEGGFRPMAELTKTSDEYVFDTSRGGPHLGEMLEQVRGLMDRVRGASPTDEQALEAIRLLKELNDALDPAVVDEWSAPSWTRFDLPSRGNIGLPPFEIVNADKSGVLVRARFRRFHLGGNGAAHGGQISVLFDDVLGMTAALYAGGTTRTAYLTLNYRSITPLDTELTLRTWVERSEGRKMFVRATLHDGDRLCAEADGLFIVLKPGQQ